MSSRAPTHALTMWLGHLIAWQLVSQGELPKGARQKMQDFLWPDLRSLRTSLLPHSIGREGSSPAQIQSKGDRSPPPDWEWGEASSRCRRAYNRETVQQPSLENSLSHLPTYSSQVKKLVLIGEGKEHCPRSQTGLGLTCSRPTCHTGKSAGLSQLALSISVCFRGGFKDEMRSPASLSTLFIHSFNNYLLRVYLYQLTEESNMARGPRVPWKTHICSDGYKTLFSTVDLG